MCELQQQEKQDLIWLVLVGGLDYGVILQVLASQEYTVYFYTQNNPRILSQSCMKLQLQTRTYHLILGQ